MTAAADPPTVSVVIPVRDDATALARCLARLAAQTVAPLEVVVVDNGSGDGSGGVARAAGARVVLEPRRGIPAAAAAGYDAARGDVIARCDADSLVPTDWIERIRTAFADDEQLDGLTGPGSFTDVPRPWRGAASLAYAIGAFGASGAAIANVPLWGSNMAVRRSAWQAVAAQVERLDPRVHDDIDLSMRLGPRARVRFDPRLRVEAEGRIFRSRQATADRLAMAMRTFRRNWAIDGSAGRRWLHRFAGRGLREPETQR
ncbi:glycosyltransferase family 2 protein [Agrococcus sp. HG114]|uniref:glycosyltransferase n=1 Tax=Agrococcus sp. HG114 TaxID=2969757 RepID=UPI00215AEF23|nr:glycosyltransferase family 2 protein [Agrococcus sp. HG114]MCR8670909.1 glycosyltransferase family 2 protein [Agrococcus sp. HG114]